MSGIKTKVPSSWELVKLGDFVESQKGKKPKNEAKNESSSHPIPYVDIQAFEEKIVRTWTDGVGCHPCYESDFLMVWDGSRSGLVGKGANGALGSTLVRINFPLMVNDYAYYFLQSKYQQINTRAKGSGTPHVDPDLLWNYDFPIPPLAEQHRIVAKIEELFSELDKGIESIKLAQVQLNVYRQALLKHAFEGKLTAEWREKNKVILKDADLVLESIQLEREQNHLYRIKAWEADKRGEKPRSLKSSPPLSDVELAELPELPKGWAWQTIAATCLESTLGKMLDKEKNKGELKPYLRNINVRWGQFNLDSLLEMRFENDELSRYGLIEGDLVICEGGEPGRCAVWRSLFGGDMLIQKALHRVRFTESVNSFYVQKYFELCASNRRLEKMFTGTTIKHFTGEKLARMAIPICSIDEQTEILQILEAKLSEIDQLQLAIATSLQQSKVFRQSILQKAFSGQLVPQDLNDEPASELLSRIKAEVAKSKPIKKKKAP